MSFSEILNATIATLISSLVIVIVTAIFRKIRKSYQKNPSLFFYNFSFYFNIIAITSNALCFDLDEISLNPFSCSISNLISLSGLIVCIVCTVYQYKLTKDYIKDTYNS